MAASELKFFSDLTKMSHLKHSNKMLLSLHELRNCSNLCDGEIILSDGTVNVQCNVLAAGSPYFRLVSRDYPQAVLFFLRQWIVEYGQ